ncbi:fibronectin type III domain-containing protein [Cohnella thailandensis]|uniref:Fibronectin type III domain-containing protein n=1 Tax=Cohnella thailandensis TaxID=557557 RepID=A0A841SYA5_9BACL|nr:fibronectin type III domain-containing protein [Cohnella thailandensis]MBB6634577.1 fibronectin type III domain-containing protein [Cohnella thailandensis]MBP1972867.1 chitodextrinase [Cohnella thailandensis]
MKRFFFLVLAVLLLLPTIGQASAEEAPQSACTSGGDGTAESPYVLCTDSDLELLRIHPDAHFELGADIHNMGPWNSSFFFSGTLDGLNHTISGFFTTGAMFYSLQANGVIRNLNLGQGVVSDISGTVASLVYNNYGLVDNCSFSGSIGAQYGGGGLVAYNYGEIRNSRTSGSVGGWSAGGIAISNAGVISNSYSDSKVSGVYYAGGVVSTNSGVIQMTEAHGLISRTIYSGTPVGSDSSYYFGGLVAKNNTAGTLDHSYAYGNLYGNDGSKVHYGGLYGSNEGSINESVGYGQYFANDSIAPTAPGNVVVTSIKQDSITLTWDASTDNVGISDYHIVDEGKINGWTSSTTYTATGLEPNTTYHITVTAGDVFNNRSAESIPVTITTETAPEQGPPVFYKGINFNGSAVTVGGNVWLAESVAGVTISSVQRHAGDINLLPSVDNDTNTMLNTAIYANKTININQTLANGGYEIYLWISETNKGHSRTFDVYLEGFRQATYGSIGSMPLNEWRKYGPYKVWLQDGNLNLDLIKINEANGDPTISGMEIYSTDLVPPPQIDTTPPTAPGNLRLVSKTHDSVTVEWDASQDNVGVDSYDVMQDGVVIDQTSDTTTDFSGLSPNTTYSFTVQARDVNGNQSNPSEELLVTTNPVSAPEPIFVKGINFNGSGYFIEDNMWLAEDDASIVSTSTARRYTDNASLQPAVNDSTSMMLNSALFSDDTFSISQQLANGTYQIYLWTIETYLANFRSFDVKMEGAILSDTPIGTMPLNEWRKYGPFTVTVQDGVLDMELVKVFGDPSISGMAIYSVDTE